MNILPQIEQYSSFRPSGSVPPLESYILRPLLWEDSTGPQNGLRLALGNQDLRDAVRSPRATRSMQRTAEALIAFRTASQVSHNAGKLLDYTMAVVGAVPGIAVGLALAPLGVVIGLTLRAVRPEWLEKHEVYSSGRAGAVGGAMAIGISVALSALPCYLLSCVLTWAGLRGVAALASVPLNIASKKTGLNQCLDGLDAARTAEAQEIHSKELAALAERNARYAAAYQL